MGDRRVAARPPIGTTMYCVQEHRYYIPDRAGPALEYVVFEGEIMGYYDDPARVVILLRGRDADGYTEIAYPRLKDIGTKVFFTAREAALLAQEMTEDYERRWAWTERWGDVPLRRPWAALLMEAQSAIHVKGGDGP